MAVTLHARRLSRISAASVALMLACATMRGAAAEAPPCGSTVTCAASGEDAATLRGLVDGLVAPVVADNAVGGAIVGVSWHGRRSFFGYGVEGTPAFEPDTIVEIGSITKVFTTALLAEAVEAHDVGLDDALEAHASKLGLQGLTACGRKVTLRGLADFSSGLPRLPEFSNGDPLPAFPHDDIGRYTSRDFLDWLSTWPRSPQDCGSQGYYLYSNASVGILGYLVADVRYGDRRHDWPRLAQEEILGPLRMTSTFLSVPPADEGRLARGYHDTRTGKDQAAPAWPMYAWYPAGGLRSDAADMLAFGEAALRHASIGGASVPPRLSSALEAAMKTATRERSKDGRQTVDQALAWVQRPSPGKATLYVKDGGTEGFASVIVINTNKDLAVFVAFNKKGTDAAKLGTALSRNIR